MSAKLLNLIPKLLSFEHKCKETKCKQMSEEFENMKKFILYSNQLNIHYLNLINDSENFIVDDKEVYRKEKENLFLKIKSEVQIIGETVRQIISGQNDTNLKTNYSKVICDLCEKRFPSNQMSTHLTEHLDRIFARNPVVNNNHNSDENLNETNIENQCLSTEISEDFQKLLCSTIKEEPFFDDNSADGSVRSDNFDAMDNISSDGETTESEQSIEPPKRRSKRNKTIKSKLKKTSLRKSNKEKESEQYSEPAVNCEVCGKGFKTQKRLNLHLGIVHKKYKTIPNSCDLCDFKTINNTKYRSHMMDVHNTDPEKEKSLHCSWPECSLTFFYKTTLHRHMRYHTDEFPFKCSWPGCSRQCKDEKQLDVHMRVHTGEKPFECHWPGCESTFGHRGSLRSHMLRHDKTKLLRHVCHYPECGRSYEVKKLLRQHIFSIHEKNNKPFRCPHEGCGSSFVASQNLQKHIASIHQEGRIKYECEQEGCNRTFYDIAKWEHHKMKPHEKRKKTRRRRPQTKEKVTKSQNSDKPEKSDKPKKKYLRHPTPTQCDWPGCDYVAKFVHKIKEHKARAHTPQEKRLVCDHPGCDFRAVRRFDLKCHVLKHTGETPYPCEYPQCGRRFKSQRAKETHAAKNHPLF